ncbi:ceramide transfer protein-like isoform X2 [Corticium candelabrum]|uniref:ceramide transfer protein-like isoform X2 n=1 Tax=Corticium candelabrum TaxID=121492 RepID=UPI002E25D1CD|nr:ceramide transfer protein-like isoform X2 [Corticium candelabrum]
MADHSSDDNFSEEEEEEQTRRFPEFQGLLSKWTNFFHGWQDRWVVLSHGQLIYYKSEADKAHGCRGSVQVQKDTAIKAHEFDESRFDVSVHDCVYYLRAESPADRQKWLDMLDATKAVIISDNGYGSDTPASLSRYSSKLSLNSMMSQQSSSSFTQLGPHLREKLNEMETYREILCKQVDTLQAVFDACHEATARAVDEKDDSQVVNAEEPELADTSHSDLKPLSTETHNDTSANSLPSSPALSPHKTSVATAIAAVSKGVIGVDYRGEAFTFKATTAGVLSMLSHCVELMNKREDQWKSRLKKERERRLKLKEDYESALSQAKRGIMAGPDYEEGPHSALNEEEFFDAVEMALDQQDEIESARDHLPRRVSGATDSTDSNLQHLQQHRLSEMVEEKVKENLQYAYEDVGTLWSLVHEDGDMKVYRRDLEEGGVVLDPLKAHHTIPGVTAHEVCHYFFDKDYKLEYDGTIDTVKVLESLNATTLVFHQIHKRVWPSSQRDTCFVSHMRPISAHPSVDVNGECNGYMVCNFSIDHNEAPTNKFVRARLNIVLIAFTILKPREAGTELTRNDITCKIVYSAHVNPGGWAPAAAVRQVAKRECPKFLRRITQLIHRVTEDKPIML